LPNSESIATQFGCRFLNQQHSYWLPIFESVVTQCLATKSESAATQFVIADF